MAKEQTRFAGRLRKPDMLIGKRQTIIDKEEKLSKQHGVSGTYFDVQALVEGEGLVRYTTGAKLLVRDLIKEPLPRRDKVIQKDWRGLYFEGSVYTLEEEEEMARKKFNVNY